MNIHFIIFKYIACVALALSLGGCLGGTVAQQIARSIATSIADKSVARAMDVDEDQAYSNRKPDYNQQTSTLAQSQTSNLPQPYQPAPSATQGAAETAKQTLEKNQANLKRLQQEIVLAQTDPYHVAIANTAFAEVKPITEPLPSEVVEANEVLSVIQTSQLVRVELFNMLIGEEKNAVYEQARLIGATTLPMKREWSRWRVATGATQPDKKLITFIIPPEFCQLASGSVTMVQLANPGELNVARYKTQ